MVATERSNRFTLPLNSSLLRDYRVYQWLFVTCDPDLEDHLLQIRELFSNFHYFSLININEYLLKSKELFG